jgi:hypothetical protein
MDHLVKCGICGTALAEVPGRSVVQVVCANCHFKYQIIDGRVAASEARHVVHRRVYREYELQLELANGGREDLRFSVHERDRPAPVRRGDDVAIVHSMRGKELEELLYIQNFTNDSVVQFAWPGSRANRSATRAAMFLFVVLFIVALRMTNDEPLLLIAFVGAAVAVSVAARAWMRQLMLPRHALAADIEENGKATQRLLEQKHSCLKGLDLVQHSMSQNEARRQRLVSLGNKMLDVGLDVYKPRFAAIDRALATLEKQRRVDVALREGYERVLKMLDIELEAGAATDQFDSDVTETLLAKLDELRVLEERQADLIRELRANLEVEQLLRGRDA